MPFEPIASSPLWSQTMPPGPDPAMKITEAYAKLVGADAFFWAWPLAGVYNRRQACVAVPEIGYAGPVPSAPLNRLGMLTDYVAPQERIVACPNQDVVYGGGSLALEQTPVIVQVPDFGDRFWVYQVTDTRTDSFVQLGSMYGTTPGFYLLVGPAWVGDVPAGISVVFRSPTNTGMVIPRVFLDDNAADRQAIQPVLQFILMYPLAEYDGEMKQIDWNTVPHLPNPASGDEEIRWVVPEAFIDELPDILSDAPPLPGEEARYAQLRAVLQAAADDNAIKQALIAGAREADERVVTPLLQFRNYGQQLPHNWSTISNESAFGVDYFTRTAVARSNIFVNAPKETKYFYQDLDNAGSRLNGAHRYTVTFPAQQAPPVHGFWSLTLYNEHHFFAPNPINRYSVGTKNKDLQENSDGSLTVYVQAEEPSPEHLSNWLPAPAGADFSLYLRTYWPRVEVTDGTWTPPPVLTA